MAVVVRPEVWSVAPGWRLVLAYGEDLAAERAGAGLSRAIEASCAAARARFELASLAAQPGIAAWRRLMPGKDFRPAHEALLRRVLAEKPLAPIHPLVDLYNALSVAHCAPMGAWDVDALAGGELALFRTRGGEPFTELGGRESVRVDAGEIAYGDAEVLVTRHFVWRQGERAKITAATRRFVLVSEVLPELGPRAAEEILAAALAGLEEHFGLDCRGTILASPATRWEWAS